MYSQSNLLTFQDATRLVSITQHIRVLPIKNSFDLFRGLSVVYEADRPCTGANRPWNTAESPATSIAHLLVAS